MLAGAGAFQAERAVHQLVVQRLGRFALFGLARVDRIADVEITVIDMADQEVRNATGVGLGDRQAFDFASAEARICRPFRGNSICHPPPWRTHRVGCSFF